jgi:hypothetical protein
MILQDTFFKQGFCRVTEKNKAAGLPLNLKDSGYKKVFKIKTVSVHTTGNG